MSDIGIGTGLAIFAFWGFLAIVIAVGGWQDVRKREARQETLRHLIASGQPVDQSLTDRIIGSSPRLDHSLKAGGVVVLFAAAGLALLGWFLSLLAQWALFAFLGTAALAGCIGIGLLVASKVIERSSAKDDALTSR